MAFHPKQITQFLSSRVGIIIIVFLVGGFALAFYSFSNKQVAAQKAADSHQIDKLDSAPTDATPVGHSQNDNTVSDVDPNTDERVYDRPPTVALPDLPPPPPPQQKTAAGTPGLYNALKPPPPTPPPPPLMVAHYGNGNGDAGEPTPAPQAPGAGGAPGGGRAPVEGPPGEYTGDFAPFGRLLKCELVNTVDSSDSQTPIIAFVTDDLWWNGKLIIPAGTEVHGLSSGGSGSQDTSVTGAGGKATPQNPSSGGTLRDRLTVGGDWILVMPPYDEAPNGAELSLNAIALDRENLTANDDGSWGITDGSYGIKGNIIDDRGNDRLIEFLGDFIAGALPTLESQEVTSVPTLTTGNGSGSNTTGTVYTTPRATLSNGALQGFSTAVAQQVQNIQLEIQRDGYYIRVPAGRQFYLYVTQTIDPTDAHIGENFRSHSVVGAVKKVSPPNLFASFMRSLGKPQSNIVSPDEAAQEQQSRANYVNSLKAQQDNERTTEESQLQTLMDQQDTFLKTVSKTQLNKNAEQALNMAPPTPPPSNP